MEANGYCIEIDVFDAKYGYLLMHLMLSLPGSYLVINQRKTGVLVSGIENVFLCLILVNCVINTLILWQWRTCGF